MHAATLTFLLSNLPVFSNLFTAPPYGRYTSLPDNNQAEKGQNSGPGCLRVTTKRTLFKP